MRYITAQEIKSETKVGKKMYLFDFFFVIVYMAVSFVLGNMVHPQLRFVYYIFSFCIAVFLTSKSYYNRKRRVYESIFILLQKDNSVYYPVVNISKKRG